MLVGQAVLQQVWVAWVPEMMNLQLQMWRVVFPKRSQQRSPVSSFRLVAPLMLWAVKSVKGPKEALRVIEIQWVDLVEVA